MLESVFDIGVRKYLEKTGASKDEIRNLFKVLQAGKDKLVYGSRVSPELERASLSAELQKKLRDATAAQNAYDSSHSLLNYVLPWRNQGKHLTEKHDILNTRDIPFGSARLNVHEAVNKLNRKDSEEAFVRAMHTKLDSARDSLRTTAGLRELLKVKTTPTSPDGVPAELLSVARDMLAAKGHISVPGEAIANYEKFHAKVPDELKWIYPSKIKGALPPNDIDARRKWYTLTHEVDPNEAASFAWDMHTRSTPDQGPFPGLLNSELAGVTHGHRDVRVEIDPKSIFGKVPKDIDEALEHIDAKLKKVENPEHHKVLTDFKAFVNQNGLDSGSLLTNHISNERDFTTFVKARSILNGTELHPEDLEKTVKHFREALEDTGESAVEHLDPMARTIGSVLERPGDPEHKVLGDLRFRTASKQTQEEANTHFNQQDLNNQRYKHNANRALGVGGLALATAGAIGAPIAYYKNRKEREHPNKLVGQRGSTPLIGRK